MRVGIISDIHSNIDALKAIWNEFEKLKVDTIICTGDIIGIGPYSSECVRFIMNNKDKFSAIIRGNHEGYLINGIPKTVHNIPNGKKLSDDEINNHIWNHNQLSADEKEFLYNLPIKQNIVLNGKKIAIEHYPMDKTNEYKKFYKNLTGEILDTLFEDKTCDIYLFGHTHIQHYSQKANNFFINPGSVGCPTNSNKAFACYLDINHDIINYSNLEIEYDVEKVISDIKTIDYPNNKLLLKIFYGQEI